MPITALMHVMFVRLGQNCLSGSLTVRETTNTDSEMEWYRQRQNDTDSETERYRQTVRQNDTDRQWDRTIQQTVGQNDTDSGTERYRQWDRTIQTDSGTERYRQWDRTIQQTLGQNGTDSETDVKQWLTWWNYTCGVDISCSHTVCHKKHIIYTLSQVHSDWEQVDIVSL